MRELGSLGGQRLVVEGPSRLCVERETELVLPAEFEPRFAESIVPDARARVALGEVCRVSSDLVRYDAGLHIILVWKTEVLLWRYIAEHRRAEPPDHSRSDCGRDVIVAWGDIRHERAECVERSAVAELELLVHVLSYEVHGNVARPFDHD